VRTAARVDENQSEIVEGLRACGWAVYCAHGVGEGFPDLVVGVGQGGADGVANILIEVKRDKSARLTGAQKDFHREWRGPLFTAVTLDEAIAAVQSVVRLRRPA